MALFPSNQISGSQLGAVFGTPGSKREPISPTLLVYGTGFDLPNTAPGDLTPRGTISFDVVISETHGRDCAVTEHTVEQGSAVVDHVRPNPQTLTLEVFVSNVPITAGADRDFLPFTVNLGTPGDGSFFAGGTGALIQSGLQALGFAKPTPTTTTVTVLQFEGEVDFVRAALDQLTDLMERATLFEIYTPKANYDDMVLSGIEMHRDKGTGTSGFFTLHFKQIRIVASKIVDAPLPTILRATPPPDKGKKDTAVATGPKKSGLAFIADALGAVVKVP